MIAHVIRHDLDKAVARLNGMWSTSDPMPILTGILLSLEGDRLTLSAANGTLWGTTSIRAEGEPGQAVVDAKQFSALVRRLPQAEVKLEYANETLTITSDKMKAELATMPADDFPDAPKKGEQILHLASGQLGDIVSRVGMCVKKDGAYSVFAGVLLQATTDGLYAVATDTSRLASMQLRGVIDMGEWIVPGESLLQAAKAVGDEVSVFATDTHICLDSDDATTYIQLLAGKFPDWDRVIPMGNNVAVTANRKDLIGALERAVLFEDRGAIAVTLDIGDGVMRVTGKNTQTRSMFTESVPCTAGIEFSAAFQARFVLDGLKAMCGDDVTILFDEEGGLNPALIEEDGWQYVLMPVRSV